MTRIALADVTTTIMNMNIINIMRMRNVVMDMADTIMEKNAMDMADIIMEKNVMDMKDTIMEKNAMNMENIIMTMMKTAHVVVTNTSTTTTITITMKDIITITEKIVHVVAMTIMNTIMLTKYLQAGVWKHRNSLQKNRLLVF